MTPKQLQAYAAIVRLGSARAAAEELGVTEAAVSLHVAALRKELGDQLFHRSPSGPAFTPGGLRLATRAVELLGLQDRTRKEVIEAADGRRVLRLAATSMFAEHAAPGLIELFSRRAQDLEVELVVQSGSRFEELLATHGADVAIGPQPRGLGDAVVSKPFLRYQIVLVTDPSHRLAGRRASAPQLAAEQWLLGPSAAEPSGATRALLARLRVPEANQRIFQSHAAAVEEAKRGVGVAAALLYAVREDLNTGRLAQVEVPGPRLEGMWTAMTLPIDRATPAAAELLRFITTPRATQAMLNGSGANIARFRPSVHITLWS